MSYQVWSVVFGEQPSASKWNILGTNDAEFNSLIQRSGTGLLALDSNGNEIIKGAAVASAVNEVTATNAAASSPPILESTGSDTNIHLVVRAKGNGLLKTSVLRQDNTTNAYKHNSVILTGWGVMAYPAATQVAETVTMGITFADRPIVLVSFGGDHGTLQTYGSGSNTVEAGVMVKAESITTSTFGARFYKPTGNFGTVGAYGFYQWLAIGELA